jgi:hypothetical protein
MKRFSLAYILGIVLLGLVLLGCVAEQIVGPTNTPAPTDTPTPLPTDTLTPTMTPTITPVPVIFLQGRISLTGKQAAPFPTTLVLHGVSDFKTSWNAIADADGQYSFVNITPGEYNLWVMVTDQKSMVTGCSDVTSPDKNWKVGMHLGATTTLTMDSNFSLLQVINMKGFGGISQIDFISPALKLDASKPTQFDVNLICK